MNNLTRSNRYQCLILGGGGHARVLIDCLKAAGLSMSMAILDSDVSRWNTEILGVPVIGPDSILSELVKNGTTCFIVGLGAIGDNRPRQRLFELGLSFNLSPVNVLHPGAVISREAQLGKGVQLLPGCIVNVGAVLGDNVIINSGAIVEHDCVIEDHVHIATGARLASTVKVGKGTHIGVGATIRQCLRIGDYAVVGAGSVVIDDVPSNTVVVGVPAKKMQEKA